MNLLRGLKTSCIWQKPKETDILLIAILIGTNTILIKEGIGKKIFCMEDLQPEVIHTFSNKSIPKRLNFNICVLNPYAIIGAEEVMFDIKERFVSLKCVSPTAKLLVMSKEDIF